MGRVSDPKYALFDEKVIISMKITVFTPTYNRAYILGNLYHSLQRQTFKDFEWLIVDDGSSDDTRELVDSWICGNNFFVIRYYKQENGGKCRAINRGLALAEGELFLVVDSDDYLTDSALEKIALWEGQLPRDQSYCGVAGNLGTGEKDTADGFFARDFFDGTLLDRYRNVNGERAMAFYTAVHRMYLYPVFDGEKFMTEAVAYNRMAHDGYKMRFYNDIICIYKYLDDGLTKASDKLFLRNPQGYGLWLRERAEFMGASRMQILRMWYTFFCDTTDERKEKRMTIRQCADCIGAPLSTMWLIAVLRFGRTQMKQMKKSGFSHGK